MPQTQGRELTAKMEFSESARYTLGVEIEFQILDRESAGLAPLAQTLLDSSPSILKPRLSEELIQSILEIQTGVCFSLEDVENDLLQTCSLAEELAAEYDCILHASSLHPFARADQQILSSNARYQAIMEELQLVGRQFISQGFHVHIGMPDGETAVRVCNQLQTFLPLLLGASGSSPYFQGEDTGFSSYRTKLFELLPLAGIYNYIESWHHFQQEVSMLIQLGVIKSIRDLWWDVRLQPNYGTVEVRICDLPGRFSDILGLTACIQCLAAVLAESKEHVGPLNGYILQANKWQAARHGLRGSFIDPTGFLSSQKMSIGHALKVLVKKLEPMSIRLGCEDYLARMQRILDHGTTADLQRNIYSDNGDLVEVVRMLHGEFWK